MAEGTDMRQSWQCALWCGVARRLIQERLTKEPALTALQVSVLKRSIVDAARGVDYLTEPADEALGLLGIGSLTTVGAP